MSGIPRSRQRPSISGSATSSDANWVVTSGRWRSVWVASRPMRFSLNRTAIAALLFAVSASAQKARPVVHVIGTGGTIGSAGDYWGGNATRVPIAELVKVPGIDTVAVLESEQMYNVGS